MHDTYTVQNMETSVPVEDFLVSCIDVDTFLGYCRECHNYDQRWSCPPYSFDPLTLWRQFRTLRLFARVLSPKPDTTLETLMEGLKQEKDKLLNALLALEQDHPKSMVLSAGSCALCGEDCTRPSGAPCRKPDEMRYSIEALGGDVAKTAQQYFQKPLLWIKDGKAPDYLTLVGGLLLPEEDR